MPTVFIVDNDETVRIALLRLIESEGLRAEGFADAEAFLRAFTPGRPGCLLLDMVLPGMSGLDCRKNFAPTTRASPSSSCRPAPM